MLYFIYNIRNNRTRCRKLSCSASVKHCISEYIAMYKNRIKDIIYAIQWMRRAQQIRSNDGMDMIFIPSAACKKLDRHSHCLCIHHIFFCNLRDPLCINIFKIHLLSGNQR